MCSCKNTLQINVGIVKLVASYFSCYLAYIIIIIILKSCSVGGGVVIEGSA